MNARDEAIRYCLSLGLDPHEAVVGYIEGEPVMWPRCIGYMGARAGQ